MPSHPDRIRPALSVLVGIVVFAALLWLCFGFIVATGAFDSSIRSSCAADPPFTALTAFAVLGACATFALVLTGASFARGGSARPLLVALATGIAAFLAWTALDGFTAAGCAIGV